MGHTNIDESEESEDIRTISIRHDYDIAGDSREFDDNYALSANGKIMSGQVETHFKQGHKKKDFTERYKSDPFDLGNMMFFNLDFAVEMTHLEKDMTVVFEGAIANK